MNYWIIATLIVMGILIYFLFVPYSSDNLQMEGGNPYVTYTNMTAYYDPRSYSDTMVRPVVLPIYGDWILRPDVLVDNITPTKPATPPFDTQIPVFYKRWPSM